MKSIIILISLIGFLNTPVLASEVDFSNTYISSQSPSIRQGDRTDPPILHISGVKTIDTRNEELILSNWRLILGFNPDNATFHILDAQLQNHFEPDLLQQRLRGTTWKGEYKTSKNLYTTELQFKSVQNGFIGGEIIHSTQDEPEPSSFLHAKVTGDIITQYLIDEKGDGELDWVDVERYQEIVTTINEANEGKEVDEITPIPLILDTRQLIRLKRARSIGNTRHASSRWGSHNEYRLTLENNTLSGNVGSPPESFGTKDVLTGNGLIELTLTPSEESLETEAPVPE